MQLSRSDILRKREKTECSHKVAGDETCTKNQSKPTKTNISVSKVAVDQDDLLTLKGAGFLVS